MLLFHVHFEVRQLQLELSDARRYAYDGSALETLHIERLEIACAAPEDATARLRDLAELELVERVRFVPGPARFAQLESWELAAA